MVKKSKPERGRDAALLPTLPMGFHEALGDYLKVTPEPKQPPKQKRKQRGKKR